MKYIVSLLILCSCAFAQAPPSDISIGVMSINGGRSDYAVQASGVINVMSQKSKGSVTSQVYIQLGGFFADDIYLSEGAMKELEALTGYAVLEKFYGNFSFGTGIGLMAIQKDGDNDYKSPFLFKSTYSIWDFLRVGIQAQYIPIKGEGDLTFVGINVGWKP